MRVTVNCVCCWLFRWIRLLHRYFIHLRKPQRWRVMCSSRRPCHLSSHHPRLDVCTHERGVPRWGGNGIANGLKITAALLDSDSQWMSKWGNCQWKGNCGGIRDPSSWDEINFIAPKEICLCADVFGTFSPKHVHDRHSDRTRKCKQWTPNIQVEVYSVHTSQSFYNLNIFLYLRLFF